MVLTVEKIVMAVQSNTHVLNAQLDMSSKEIDVKNSAMRDTTRMKTMNAFPVDSVTAQNVPQQTATAVTMNSSYMMI